MAKKYSALIVLFIFIIFSTVIFRKYIFGGFVPFPSNLLVSFYSPWKYESWEGYPNGPANKPIGFDVLKLFYPYRTYTTERLKNAELPLWNPYVFSGNIHLATYQSAVFYPLNAFYFFLPMIDAWSILVLVQPILAGFFTYLFLRSIKLGDKASFFGSIVFAFSGWIVAWSEESLVIEHSALWLPLVLYGVQNLSLNNYKKGFLVIVLGLTCSILAGFLQMTLYIGFFSLAFLVFNHSKAKNKTALFYFLYSGLVSVGISAIHLFPAFISYFYSPRGVVATPFIFDTYLMKPWHLITFIAPDFWGSPGSYNYFGGPGFYHEKVIFIGIPALLLIIYILVKSGPEKSTTLFFKRAGIITLLLGFFPLGWLLYYSKLPIISAMVPSRIFFLSTFSFAVLAAFGMERLMTREWDNKLIRRILLAVTIFLGFLWIFVFCIKFIPLLSEFDPKDYYANTAFRNLVVPTVIFLCCSLLFLLFQKFRNRMTVYYFSFVLLSALSSLYFAQKILYFSERKFVFPEVPVLSKVKELAGINRVWGYGNAYIEKNMMSFYEIYSPEGYDALFSQHYGELLYVQETQGEYTNQISRTDAHIRPIGEKDKLLDGPLRMRLLSTLGVRYILESKKGEGKDLLTVKERFPEEHFTLTWEDSNFRIWEYKKALPRTFLVGKYIVEKESAKTIETFFDANFNPLETVILDNEPPRISCRGTDIGTSTVQEYLPEKVVIKTNSGCDTLLFLSDTYYPGWIGRVDNEEVPILRANHAFRAISVPSGDHVVEFSYEPKEVRWGMYISIALVLLFWPLYLFFRRFIEQKTR